MSHTPHYIFFSQNVWAVFPRAILEKCWKTAREGLLEPHYYLEGYKGQPPNEVFSKLAC